MLEGTACLLGNFFVDASLHRVTERFVGCTNYQILLDIGGHSKYTLWKQNIDLTQALMLIFRQTFKDGLIQKWSYLIHYSP